jgi:hypothetical protein
VSNTSGPCDLSMAWPHSARRWRLPVESSRANEIRLARQNAQPTSSSRRGARPLRPRLKSVEVVYRGCVMMQASGVCLYSDAWKKEAAACMGNPSGVDAHGHPASQILCTSKQEDL